jgi:hypothetical protein
VKRKEAQNALTPKQVVELATTIRNKLIHFGVGLKTTEALDGLPVHLADTYEVCFAYTNIVRSLLDSHMDQITEVNNLTAQIEYHLYVHLPYHLKRLLPGLRAFSKSLNKQQQKSRSSAKRKKRVIPT